MSLRLHNTLSGKAELFRPLKAGEVTFYSCGPTVYDFAHIGNFRSFLAADVLRRWLASPLCQRLTPDGNSDPPSPSDLPGGYRVRHVMNITDVGHLVDDSALDSQGEDRMEAARHRLAEQKKSGKLPPDAAGALDPADPYAIADYYARAFIDDARTLGLGVVEDALALPENRRDELLPRPTRMVREMLEMVMALLRSGHAYLGPDGVAYFDTQSFPDYGRLSGNTLDKIKAGAGGRVSAAVRQIKKHPADFMLWKPDPTHLMRWDPRKVLNDPACPLGEGYPGWHIECSAMARSRLGEVIDLHSGGEDNIFPHHECEIAQSRCATGRPEFARYWFHPRFLLVEGEKMSKSKGNFFTLRDLLARGFTPAAIRLELIKTHYRSNANFTEQGLKDSGRTAERWRDFIARGESSGRAAHASPDDAARAREAFAAAMNDDLNVAGAIGAVNTWAGRTPDPAAPDAALMRRFDAVLGVVRLAERTDAHP
ncbi:MAG: hypothetical protein IBJ11_12330, partial [Phycisphaerales bacterium]|nr:hypothetical protein [Phycisphaerales bacterium]